MKYHILTDEEIRKALSDSIDEQEQEKEEEQENDGD